MLCCPPGWWWCRDDAGSLDAGVGNWSCASPLATTFFLGISVHLNGDLYTRWELGWKWPHFYSIPKDKAFRVGEPLMLLPADRLTEPNQTFQSGLHTEAVLQATTEVCLLVFFFSPSVFYRYCFSILMLCSSFQSEVIYCSQIVVQLLHQIAPQKSAERQCESNC